MKHYFTHIYNVYELLQAATVVTEDKAINLHHLRIEIYPKLYAPFSEWRELIVSHKHGLSAVWAY